MSETGNEHADNLQDFVWQFGHLWDEERVEQVEAAIEHIYQRDLQVKAALGVINEAILHGMPVTQEIANLSNEIRGVATPVKKGAADDQTCREMLSFLTRNFQMYAPDMGGQHSYRFRSGEWPIQHMKGPTIIQAIQNAMAEESRGIEELRAKMDEEA